jgi:DNA-binding MarR family transcriptional regulator
LVQRGFVIRKENREDRRYVSLQLSPLGKEKAKEIKSVDEKMYEAMVPNFDPRKMSALYDALVDVFKDHPSAEALKKRKLI